MWICTCVRHNQPSLQISVVSFQQKINSFFQVHCPICIQSFSMYTSEIGDSTSTKSESVPVPLSVSSMEKKRKVRTGSTQFSYSEKHLPVAQETWKKNEVGTPCTSEQAVGTPATSKFVFIFKELVPLDVLTCNSSSILPNDQHGQHWLWKLHSGWELPSVLLSMGLFLNNFVMAQASLLVTRPLFCWRHVHNVKTTGGIYFGHDSNSQFARVLSVLVIDLPSFYGSKFVLAEI